MDSGQWTTRGPVIVPMSTVNCPLSTVALEWAGESLTLVPERAVWWPARRTLIAADLHLGKPAAFRAAGVPVPESVTGADLDRLSSVLERFAAARLIVLGDLLHAPSGLTTETLDRVALWRARHPDLRVMLIRGNHDRRCGDPAPALRIEAFEPPVVEGPLAFVHEPAAMDGLHVLAGHIHPCARLRGPIGGTLRAPCFWFSARTAVLPAFGTFTGCASIRPTTGDRVFLVGPGCVEEALPSRGSALPIRTNEPVVEQRGTRGAHRARAKSPGGRGSEK